MNFLKDIRFKYDSSSVKEEWIYKIFEIEEKNLEIDFSKFRHSVGKANPKTKKLIFLKHIYYHLEHLKDNNICEKIKMSLELRRYLTLLIYKRRLEQILFFITMNFTILEEKTTPYSELKNGHLIGNSLECSPIIKECLNYLEKINQNIQKKYSYSEMESIELEKIVFLIEEQKKNILSFENEL